MNNQTPMNELAQLMFQGKSDIYPSEHPFRICGALILYNPESSVVKNVQSFIGNIAELLVVDNSDVIQPSTIEELQKLPKVTYINNRGNMGIANALNMAASIAYNKKFQWLLTMDQDSSFIDGGLSLLINDLQISFSLYPNVALITPYHNVVDSFEKETDAKAGLHSITSCMTSGNIIDLEVWKSVGGFEEKLFIDYVDHEYCLRLKKFGKTIIQDDNVALNHKLGDVKTFKFLGRRTASHHNYIRRYYITRNRLYLLNQYFSYQPRLAFRELYGLFAETVKILMQERDKLKKLKSTFRGVKDFLAGHYGKYRYK
jgi:rhamnosyltransferase